MFTKIAVRSFSGLAIVVFGLFSGVAFAAPGNAANSSACPGVSASISRQECLAPGASAVLPAQEQVVVSSPAATIDHAVQEEMVLSAATGNPVGFALLAAQAAATAGAAPEYQPNDGSFHTPQTSDYRPLDPAFHTPQTSDYRPLDPSFHTPQTSDYRP